MNPQTSYVQAALQMQRWRDFGSQVFAYVIGSTVFIIIWVAQGRGFFWPIYPALVWGLGLSVQHFTVVKRFFRVRLMIRLHCTAYLPKYEIWVWSCLK